MEKYGRGRQSTDGNIIQSMCIAIWINKATDTHSECVILTLHDSMGQAKAPHSYVTYINCLSR